MTFGEKIKELRLKRNWSQTQVAKGLKLSQTTISSWEVGVSVPDISTCKKVADYFGVPLYELVIPGDDIDEDSEEKRIATFIRNSPKLKVLFDRTATMREQDIDAVLAVVNAISREKGEND